MDSEEEKNQVDYLFGPFRVDTQAGKLFCDDEPVQLGSKAFQILLVLVRKSPNVARYEDIHNTVWDGEPRGSSDNDYFAHIQVQVHKLRRKLKDCKPGSDYIGTSGGQGYRLNVKVYKQPQATSKSYHQSSSRTPSSIVSFGRWLRNRKSLFPTTNLSTHGKTGHEIIIGDSVILYTAPGNKGYEEILLTEDVLPDPEFKDLISPFKEEWDRIWNRYKGYTKSIAAPLHITLPVIKWSDKLSIECAKIEYSYMKSFHDLLEKNPDLQEKLVRQAFQFKNTSGRNIPGCVGVHAIVIMAGIGNEKESSRDPYLLLAHRTYKEGEVYSDLWSASFEEQYTLDETPFGDTVYPPDGNLHTTVLRGLKQQFLTDEFNGNLQISFHALIMDLIDLNIQLMATVRLPETSFLDVERLWLSGETIGPAEHDLLELHP